MNHVYSETISCSCQHQLALMCICSSKNHQKTHFRCIYVYFLIKSIKHHQKSSKIIKNHQKSSKIIKYIHFLVLFGFIYMFLYIFVYKYEKFTFLASILPRSCLGRLCFGSSKMQFNAKNLQFHQILVNFILNYSNNVKMYVF